MSKAIVSSLAVCLLISVVGCAGNQKRVEQEMKQPISCAHAEGNIRALRHEKTHAMDQIAAGVESIVPAGAVVGLATGAEGTNIKVATGEYNKMIDNRIAEIKRKCGVR